MVKRRCAKASASNRIKTEDKDVKSPLGGGDDVMVVARDRLKGALQDLIDHSDDDSESSADERIPTPPLARQIPAVKKEPRQSTRRRKKKVVEVDQAFHHTFVMKLFDRSVDLAQFTEDTPLYPICRAWMANQPRSNYNVTGQNSSNDQKPKVENGSPETSTDAEDVKYVYRMPPPSGTIQSRIPVSEPIHIQEITSATFEMNINKAQLLSEHMQRWGKIRRKWLQAAHTNEIRYAASGRVLSEMYKNSQKTYT